MIEPISAFGKGGLGGLIVGIAKIGRKYHTIIDISKVLSGGESSFVEQVSQVVASGE